MDNVHSRDRNSDLRSIEINGAGVLGGFWADKNKVFRDVTVEDVFSKFEASGAFENFDRVASRETGGHSGPPFLDGLIFETIRGASDFLAFEYDPALDRRLDGYIDRIAAAQATDPDGYINTFVTLECPDQRWGLNGGNQLRHHEVYNAGCLVEAATHHWRATGKVSLFSVAVRFATYMAGYIGRSPKRTIIPSHSLPEEAFIELYGLLRDEPGLAASVSARPADEYLELVRFWIENRGNHEHRISFTEYAQDHKPLAEQEEAVGHAVRAVLCYTGLTAYSRETRDPVYLRTVQRLWQDVTERKIYVTGGVGTIREYEGFGLGYNLPNNGYLETCAGIGMAFWGVQMGLLFGNAKYADIVERVLYNIVLGGVSLDGTRYAYRNPLVGDGELCRWEWHGCPCCPPMLMKLISSLPSLVCAVGADAVFVNQFVDGVSIAALDGGTVEIIQKTRYPWDGKVVIEIRKKAGIRFVLHVRIPAWCEKWSLAINGQPSSAPLLRDGYVVIERTWANSDRVEISLDMPVRRVEAHPFVQNNRARVAIQRGPIVYCTEAVDNGGRAELAPAEEPDFEWEYDSELLGGVVVIRCKSVDGRGLIAIPYFARGNRSDGADEFTVWMKQEGAVPKNVARGEGILYHYYDPSSME